MTTPFDAPGGCACGALRYRLTRAPMKVHCCHCRQCQRLTGSAFVLNAIIEADHIVLVSGEVETTPGPSESGRVHDIYRCATCSTAVWSDYGGRPNYRFVRVGTLDDPARFQPDVHVFTASKLPWVGLPEDVPACEIFYEMEDIWSPEELARRALALG
jgi:hypothetical protein